MSEPAEPVGRRTVRNREQELARTFVMLADSLVEDYDIVDLLDRLAAACVRLLGVTAAGLLLDDQQGRLAFVASSSEETRLLEVFQVQHDQGPCLECVRTGTAVVSANLEADHARWPLFASSALAAGFRSVVALPMRLRDKTIGGLNLFDDRGAGGSAARAGAADVATIGICSSAPPSAAPCWPSIPAASTAGCYRTGERCPRGAQWAVMSARRLAAEYARRT